jgi:hypothetical protein
MDLRSVIWNATRSLARLRRRQLLAHLTSVIAFFAISAASAETIKNAHYVTLLPEAPPSQSTGFPEPVSVRHSFFDKVVTFWHNLFGQGPDAIDRYVKSLGTPVYPYHAGTGASVDPKNSLDSFSAYILDSDVLYPGSLIQGDPSLIATGRLAPLGLTGAGGTLVLAGATFADGAARVYRHVSTASQADVDQAISELTHQSFAPDQFGSAAPTYHRVYSKEQAQLELDASFSGFGADVDSFFSSAQESTKNHIEFALQQTFFSVSFTPDGESITPSSFFMPDATLSEAELHTSKGSPPLYVSAVGYGRALYFMASCDASMDDMQAALNATYSSALQGGSVSMSLRHQLTLAQCQIQALAIGGSAAAAAPILSTFSGADVASQLRDYVAKGLDFGSPSTSHAVAAQPLWYKLSYLTLAPADVDVSLHYDERPVTPATYVAMRVVPTICDDDKEKQTPVNASVIGGDGTVYFSHEIFSKTPCDDNHCNGVDFYWGAHGQTYDVIPNFPLTPPMPSYMAADSTIEISGPGDTWQARFQLLGIDAQGSKTQLLSTSCYSFNGNGVKTTGPLKLLH